MFVTEFGCWWRLLKVGAWRQCIKVVDVGDPNSQKQSLTSYSCHQHISSKIYVGDLMMVTFSVVNNSYRLRTSWNCYQQNLYSVCGYSVCVSNINESLSMTHKTVLNLLHFQPHYQALNDIIICNLK